MSKSKGAHHERALARAFDGDGWMVMKSPSSGSATKRDQPDLLAANPRNGKVVAIELKYTSKNIAYVGDDELASLRAFAEAFRAKPLVGARFKGDGTYYLLEIPACHRTGSGVGVKSEYAPERAFMTM